MCRELSRPVQAPQHEGRPVTPHRLLFGDDPGAGWVLGEKNSEVRCCENPTKRTRPVSRGKPAENPNVDLVLLDAASTVASLRDEGKKVLLHCVAAQSRTPSVAAAYALLRGVPLDDALVAVTAALPAAHPNPGFRAALERLAKARDH